MPEESGKYLFDDFPTEVMEIPLSSSWRNEVFIFVCYLEEVFPCLSLDVIFEDLVMQ
jgi:hypothetical protein